MKIVKVTLEYDNGIVHEFDKAEDALLKLDAARHVDAILKELEDHSDCEFSYTMLGPITDDDYDELNRRGIKLDVLEIRGKAVE